MRAVLPFALMALLLCAAPLHAQQARELRGVWLTTLMGLDWPSASLRGNPAAQQRALLDILDDLQRRHFNVVFFQVRSRGNAMYRSAIEPWASELTGRQGREPGWDPLAFAIDACHARGMELHAWFNVNRVWTAGDPPASTPEHVARAHPSWVRRYGTDLWLDPGIPAAREYTVQVAEELVRDYDIDGLHLDYCRYPDRDFDDAATWRSFGEGENRDTWRRGNINALVREMYRRCTGIRPGLQVGSAPIGIYESLPGARGWEGRNAVYQDSREWMRGGYQDYVVPQVYWGLKSRGSGIDFEALVRDWSTHAFGRHVYIGIAAYKEHVQRWLPEMIDAVRDNGGMGEVFFRYEHIQPEDLGMRFRMRTLPPAMPWRDNVLPNPPVNVSIVQDGGRPLVSWQPPPPAADGDVARWYAVYRIPEGGLAEPARAELLAVLPPTVYSFADAEPVPGAEYFVTAVDAFRNESSAGTTQPAVAAAPVLPPPSVRPPVAALSTPVAVGDDLLLIGYTVPHRAAVRLQLTADDGSDARVLVDAAQNPGTYVVGIERSRLPEDLGLTVLDIGNERTVRVFTPPAE
jgi:uncharacterized lipoprotein YddW (UPF0748 family)